MRENLTAILILSRVSFLSLIPFNMITIIFGWFEMLTACASILALHFVGTKFSLQTGFWIVSFPIQHPDVFQDLGQTKEAPA